MNNIEITSERLFLRSFRKNDFRNFCKVNTDKNIMKYFDGGAKTIEEARVRFGEIMEHQEKYGFSYCAIFIKDSMEFIGQCGVYYNYDKSLNLCYAILESYQKKGYAFEACCAAINDAFVRYPFKYITAMSEIHNSNSISLLAKLGFKKIGNKKLYSGIDVLLFSLSKENFYTIFN